MKSREQICLDERIRIAARIQRRFEAQNQAKDEGGVQSARIQES